MKKFICLFLILAVTLCACGDPVTVITTASSDVEETTEDAIEDTFHGYSVSTSNDLATQVGMEVLEKGGNAVDAAIAVAFVLGVVEPYASGLGGGGSLLIYDSSTGETYSYDYRSAAGGTSNSYDSVAVPGFVLGMETVYEDYATMDWSDLLQYAVDYANNGFTVNETLAYRFTTAKSTLSQYSQFYNSDGDYLEEGDTMYQTALAEALESIQENGADVFYNGWIADEIANVSSLTVEDFASYEVVKTEAVYGSYNGYAIYGASAPMTSTTLIQMLEMADLLNVEVDDTATYLSNLKTITNSALSDRYNTIADSTFYDIDEQALVSTEYVAALLDIEDAVDPEENESSDTTSFSIVDSNGLVVSCTNTLSEIWGAHKIVGGIVLNNTNDNFSTSGVNAYEPYKRSRTYTSPLIVVGDDNYVLSIGTSGGKNIPDRLFQILVDILNNGADAQEAVEKLTLVYRNGTLYVEIDKNNDTWFDTSVISEAVVYRNTGSWWGSVSLAGYSDETGAFSAYDSRRGATISGAYND